MIYGSQVREMNMTPEMSPSDGDKSEYRAALTEDSLSGNRAAGFAELPPAGAKPRRSHAMRERRADGCDWHALGHDPDAFGEQKAAQEGRFALAS